jgi:hypothetical protein
MKDSRFKNLEHQVGELKISTRGSEVANGYKPDITVIDRDKRLMFILECEQKTDRKAFLGGVVKAEKYAEDCCATPTLVIVMKPFSNTTVDQIASHLELYISWFSHLKPRGLNLSQILIIADSDYELSIEHKECLVSQEFQKRSVPVDISRHNNLLQETAL